MSSDHLCTKKKKRLLTDATTELQASSAAYERRNAVVGAQRIDEPERRLPDRVAGRRRQRVLGVEEVCRDAVVARRVARGVSLFATVLLFFRR